jgi:hypothetical protein
MNFAAPAFLAAGVAAAIVVTALHFLARQRPRKAVFPTARFVPERQARAPSSALKPTDLLLLLLRVAALLFLGAAFARPAWSAVHSGTARVVLVDRSRAVGNVAQARDSADALLRDGDALVLFDSAARVAPKDSLHALGASGARGSISAALVAAHQAAAALAERVDSVELVIISPLAAEEFDAASLDIRRTWLGRVRIVRVGLAAMDSAKRGISVRGDPADALVSSGLGARDAGAGARVVRGTATRADTAWARDSAGVLVLWPAVLAAPHDTIGAVLMADDVVVASFARPAASPASRVPSTEAVARWSDGGVAASETRAGTGCIRSVSIPVPSAGDLVLRESFRRLFAGLTGPCGGARDLRIAADSLITQLGGIGPLASARGWTRDRGETPPLARWFLVAAALLLIAEPLLRRRAA